MTHDTPTRRGPEPPDLAERGGMKNGQPQRSDERLFMQLLVYGGCRDSRAVADALAGADVEGVVYEDANDPHGVAVLTLTKDPNVFLDTVRPLLNGRVIRGSRAQAGAYDARAHVCDWLRA